MSKRSLNKFLTILPIFYGLLCVAFGNNFYRISIAGITSSEFIALLTILYSAVTLRLFKFLDFRIVFFASISFLYLLYSVLTDRELYYIVRQFAFVLYIIYSFALVSVLDKSILYKNVKLLSILLLIALFTSIFSKGANIDGGVLVFYILLLVGLKFNNILAVILSIIIIFLSNHAGHTASVLLFFIGSLLLLSKRFIAPTLLISSAGLFLVIPFLLELKELNDANANWRYLFWKDAILLNFNTSLGIIGQGFGVPYINPKFENFQLLINQILWVDDGTYEMFTTPTHNSLITMYYHLGLLGLGAFLLYYLDLVYLGIIKKHYKLSLILLCTLLIIISHNALELPYMAIPIAFIFAIVQSKIGRQYAHSSDS